VSVQAFDGDSSIGGSNLWGSNQQLFVPVDNNNFKPEVGSANEN
jgi:hypothetical protein